MLQRDTGLVQNLLDGLLVVLREGLVEKGVLLEEARDPALDDLGQRLLGLALLARGLLGDAALVLHRLGRDVLAGEELRGEGGDVLRDVLGDLRVLLVQLDQHADLRGQVRAGAVQVGGDEAAGVLGEAVQDDLLAEVGVGLVHVRLDGLARLDLGGEQRRGVGRGRGGDVRGDGVGGGDELLALGDEVRLALQLDEDAGGLVVGDTGDDRAVRGGAALALGDALLALDAQDLDGLVDVAVGLVQRLLAVHHAGAGELAELLDVGGGVVRHTGFPSVNRLRPRARRRGGACIRLEVGSRTRRLLTIGEGAESRSAARLFSYGFLRVPHGVAAGLRPRRQPADITRSRRSSTRPRPRRASGLGLVLGLGLGLRLGGGLVGLRSRCLGLLALLALEELALPLGQRLGGLVAALGGFGGTGAGDEALGDGVGDHAGEQRDGADRVVVTRDLVVDLVRVAVGVEDRDDRDVELARLTDGDVLLLGVHDPDGAGHLLHLADTTERLLQLRLLAGEDEQLLLGEAGGGHVLEVDLLELLEALEALVDGREVGEHAAEPALVDVGHADAGGLLGDGLLGLLLGADEHDRAAVRDGLLDELVGAVDVRQRLEQVDDVDAVALGEDETLHLRVPATGLVPEVDAALQQLPHRDDGHGRSP